jgi:hypothetical protein
MNSLDQIVNTNKNLQNDFNKIKISHRENLRSKNLNKKTNNNNLHEKAVATGNKRAHVETISSSDDSGLDDFQVRLNQSNEQIKQNQEIFSILQQQLSQIIKNSDNSVSNREEAGFPEDFDDESIY